MMRSVTPWCGGLVLLAGCIDPQTNLPLVPDQPFGTPAAHSARLTNYAPASLEVAARVDTLGRQLLTANPQLGMQPLFRTIGAPHAEIFHHHTSELLITEGLVKQCVTEGQLAAVLCQELGKMVSEREALAGPKTRSPEREPPIDLRIGNDSGGLNGPADKTYLAERWKLDRARPKPAAAQPTVSLPPDPRHLAEKYLTNAGFPALELEAVAPILKKASEQSSLEKQLTVTPSAAATIARPWTR